MRYTYDTADADYIRTLIDPLATAETVPEATLINEYITGIGEDWAFSIITPDAEALLTSDQHDTVKRAVLVYIASTLIHETPVVTRGQMGEQSYTIATGDPTRRASRLERQAGAILRALMDLLAPATKPVRTVFKTAKGYRGR